MIKRIIVLFFVVFSVSTKSFSQCTAENSAFSAGEELNYDLFFNWKFVWVSAGSATMSIKPANFEGKALASTASS